MLSFTSYITLLVFTKLILHVCPRFRRDKLEIETIQRRATKLIPNLINLPYTDRLEAMRLPPLCCRRRRGDTIQVYNILKGIYRLESNQFFLLADISNTRGHSLKIMFEAKCNQSESDKRLERVTSARCRQPHIKYIQVPIRQTLDQERYNLP